MSKTKEKDKKGNKKFENTPFDFSADSKSLETAIRKATSAISMQAKQISLFLYGKKKKLYAIAYDQGCFCMVAVENSNSDGNGVVCVDSTVLLGSLKNRGVVNFKFTGSECEFKVAKGSYKGTIVTMPITSEQSIMVSSFLEENIEGNSFSSELMKLIRHGVDCTAISEVLNDDLPVVTVISMTKKELKVGARASHEFAFFHKEISKGSEWKAALPASYFSAIDAVSGDQDCNIKITKTQLYVSGQDFILSLPSIQADDREYTMIEEYMKAMSKAQFSSSFELKDLAQVLDNMFSLYREGGSGFEFNAKEDSLHINLSTVNGQASDKLKIKGKGEIRASVDPRLIRNVISVGASSIKSKLSFQITNEVMLVKGLTAEDGSVTIACPRQNNSETSEKKKKK